MDRAMKAQRLASTCSGTVYSVGSPEPLCTVLPQLPSSCAGLYCKGAQLLWSKARKAWGPSSIRVHLPSSGGPVLQGCTALGGHKGWLTTGKMGKALREYLCDVADIDRKTLAKAVLAEYFCMTLFLFFTIGTISSNCHAGDIVAASGAQSKTLQSSEHLMHQPAKHPFRLARARVCKRSNCNTCYTDLCRVAARYLTA